MSELISAHTNYTTQIDYRPAIFQQIRDLSFSDIIPELIQNEIDAGSKRTIIEFKETEMVCSGNGASIDEEGWQRLRYFLGAGDEAPRKRNSIGVKNHGLKACFRLGDDIYLRSSGRYTHQTLYTNGTKSSPHPGALEHPIDDPSTPSSGVRIEVPYRTKVLATDVGEPVRLEVADTERVERLFHDTIHEIQSRFIAAVRPGDRSSYATEIKHYSLGMVRFEFSAGRQKKVGKDSWFVRHCRVSGSASEGLADLRERAVTRSINRPAGIKRDVFPLFQEKSRLVIEVAWEETPDGKRLVPTRGMLRYPIEYPDVGPGSRSGFGAHYSAPFISDTERHGAIAEDAWNAGLMFACDVLLADCIKELNPRLGAKALDLLDAARASEARLKNQAELLLRAGALPVVRSSLINSRKKERRSTRRTNKPRLAPRGARIIVPVYGEQLNKHAEALAAIVPPGCWVLDSGVPGEVRKLLAGQELDGWLESHITFDEDDALNRLRPPDDPDRYFPWPDEQTWRATLANPTYARATLDAILGVGQSGGDIPDAPQDAHVPDNVGQLRPVYELHRGSDIPSNAPSLVTPPLIHPRLEDHPLLAKKHWNLEAFGIYKLLDALKERGVSTSDSSLLFSWVSDPKTRIPRKAWKQLKELPIWPSEGLEFCELEDLCKPDSPEIRKILHGALKAPTANLEKLVARFRKQRVSLRLRDTPSEDEIANWFQVQLERFPCGKALLRTQKTAFFKFEKQIATLASNNRIERHLATVNLGVPVLSQSGALAPSNELITPSREINRMQLPSDIMALPRPKVIERVWPTRIVPEPEQIRSALSLDPQNVKALIPRLERLAKLLDDQGEGFDLGVDQISCIPIHGVFYKPCELCLKRSGTSVWGKEYRREVNATGLAKVDQDLYVRAGVLPAEPTGAASRAYFQWLSERPDCIERHLTQILEQIIHRQGVTSWWESFPQLPCIPVEGSKGIELVSLHLATNKRSQVFIDDFPQVADAIRRDFRRQKLVVSSVEGKTLTVSELLQKAGVRRLREACGEPNQVTANGPASADDRYEKTLGLLRSKKMATTIRQRLSMLGVPLEFLRPQWQDRLRQILQFKFAEQVVAGFQLGRTVKAEVGSAFDARDGTLWLRKPPKDGRIEVEQLLFQALSGRVFVDHAPGYCALALRQALEIDVYEIRQTSSDLDAADTDSVDDQGDVRSHETSGRKPSSKESEKDGPGASRGGHHHEPPDPMQNIPIPKPLSTGPDRDSNGRRRRQNSSKNRKADELESLHISELKENQYAWHCQIALAKSSVSQLARQGSYAEFAANRKKMVEAHHPDAVTSGGARHAGNLLILSHFEHHRVGNLISRQQIRDGLLDATPKAISFGSGRLSKEVQGYVAKIKIPSTGEVIDIFFTKFHRDYWLNPK